MTKELEYALSAVSRAGKPCIVKNEEYATKRRILSIARGISKRTDGSPMAQPVPQEQRAISPHGDLSDEY